MPATPSRTSRTHPSGSSVPDVDRCSACGCRHDPGAGSGTGRHRGGDSRALISDALADAGLFGILGPVEAGGSDLSARAARRIIAAIAGGCGATFFVWVQHHGVVRAVRNSPNDAVRDASARAALLRCEHCGRRIRACAARRVRRQFEPRVSSAVGSSTDWPRGPPRGASRNSSRSSLRTTHGDLVWAMVDSTRIAGITPHRLELPVLAGTGRLRSRSIGSSSPMTTCSWRSTLAAWRAVDRRTSSIGQTAATGVAIEPSRCWMSSPRLRTVTTMLMLRLPQRRCASRSPTGGKSTITSSTR